MPSTLWMHRLGGPRDHGTLVLEMPAATHATRATLVPRLQKRIGAAGARGETSAQAPWPTAANRRNECAAGRHRARRRGWRDRGRRGNKRTHGTRNANGTPGTGASGALDGDELTRQ